MTSAKALLKARNASHRSHAASQQQADKEQLLDTESVKKWVFVYFIIIITVMKVAQLWKQEKSEIAKMSLLKSDFICRIAPF